MEAGLRGYERGTLVVVERVPCPPWMPRRAVASLHGGLGIVRGVCACYGLRLEAVLPLAWQTALFGKAPPHHSREKHRRGSTRKDVFVLAARDRWAHFEFPKTWGMADAAWLAVYGARFLSPGRVYTAA